MKYCNLHNDYYILNAVLTVKSEIFITILLYYILLQINYHKKYQ
jgi:hypothetical protein